MRAECCATAASSGRGAAEDVLRGAERPGRGRGPGSPLAAPPRRGPPCPAARTSPIGREQPRGAHLRRHTWVRARSAAPTCRPSAGIRRKKKRIITACLTSDRRLAILTHTPRVKCVSSRCTEHQIMSLFISRGYPIS